MNSGFSGSRLVYRSVDSWLQKKCTALGLQVCFAQKYAGALEMLSAHEYGLNHCDCLVGGCNPVKKKQM